MRGFVYILVNPSLEGLVKIGHTSRTVEQRCAELSAATGVPTPFIAVYEEEVNDAPLVERMIHQQLGEMGFRPNSNREFFSAPVKHAVKVINNILSANPDFLNLEDTEHPTENDLSISENSKNLDIAFNDVLNILEQANDPVTAYFSDNNVNQSHFFDKQKVKLPLYKKAERKLELLVDEKHSKSYGLLFDVLIYMEKFDAISVLFDKAEKAQSNDPNSWLSNYPLGEIIGKTLLLPKRSVVPVEIYQWVKKCYFPTIMWLTQNFSEKMNEIKYHIMQANGDHFIDSSIDMIHVIANSDVNILSENLSEDFLYDAREYLDISIGKNIIEDLFENHVVTLKGSGEFYQEEGFRIIKEGIEKNHSAYEDLFTMQLPLASMIADIVAFSNLCAGYLMEQEKPEAIIEAARKFDLQYEKKWLLGGIRQFI